MRVIVNPAAGKGRGAEIGRAVEARLRERGHTATRVFTQGARHAVELARAAVAERCDVVAVAGGDGTISECAEGLLGSECRLALLPTGTGNDLARALGIRENADTAAMLEGGRTRSLDAWRLNDRVFVNVAGVGFDAEVAAHVGRSERRIGGTAAYVLLVLSTLRRYRPRDLQIRVDDAVFTGRVMMVALANSPYYGGGMKVAPAADPSDGLLDVIVIQEVSKLRFLAQFPRVFHGTHVTDPAVKQLRGRTVTIEGDPDTPVMADGEPCGAVPVRVVAAGASVTVIVP